MVLLAVYCALGGGQGGCGRTDAEEQEGQERDGVAAEFPAQRAGRGRLLCRLHGGGAGCVAAGAVDWRCAPLMTRS